MAYKVPAPSVYITFGNRFNTLLNNRLDNKTLKELKDDQDVFILGPNSDIQLLNFEHNVIGGADGTYAVFTFIDPNHQLENRILSLISPRIMGPLIEARHKDFQTPLTGPTSDSDFLTQMLKKSDAVSLLRKEVVDSVETFRVDLASELECSFSYKTGGDEWDNSFSGKIGGFSFSHTGAEGVRVLTLRVATTDANAINSPELLDTLVSFGNFSLSLKGSSIPILTDSGFEPIMNIIQSCLREYLTIATGSKNVLIMLPDITQTTGFRRKYNSVICSNGFTEPLVAAGATPFIGRNPKALVFNTYKQILKDFGFTIVENKGDFVVEANQFGPICKEQYASKRIKDESVYKTETRAVLRNIIEASREHGDNLITEGIGSFRDTFEGYLNFFGEGTYPAQRLTMFVESNIDSVSFFREAQNNKVFSEYTPISDSKNRCLIFGENELIRRVLYGVKYLEDESFPLSNYSYQTIFDSNYREEAFEYFFPNPKGDTFYGVDSYRDNNLDLEDNSLFPENKTNQRILKRLGLPFLTGGAVKNPNILSFSITSNNSLLASLIPIFVAKNNKLITDVLTKSSYRNFIKNNSELQKLFNYLDDFKNSMNDDEILLKIKSFVNLYSSKNVKRTLQRHINSFGNEQFSSSDKGILSASILASIRQLESINESIKTDNAAKILYDEEIMSKTSAITTYLDALLRFNHSLTVNTLPHFYLDAKYVGQSCWFLYKEHGLVGNNTILSDQDRERIEQSQNALNGRYTIKSIKHTINDGDVGTQLTLIRNGILGADV